MFEEALSRPEGHTNTMNASRRGDIKMDEKTGQPKNKASCHQMEDAHGHYVAGDAKKGRKAPLPFSPAPGDQPNRATPKG